MATPWIVVEIMRIGLWTPGNYGDCPTPEDELQVIPAIPVETGWDKVGKPFISSEPLFHCLLA